jgi:hypothetical protein
MELKKTLNRKEAFKAAPPCRPKKPPALFRLAATVALYGMFQYDTSLWADSRSVLQVEPPPGRTFKI